MAWTGKKKAFCVLEFGKTESFVTEQRRFQTVHHTEPPADKTIRECYMKSQQSGCLCAAKRTGWLCVWQELDYRITICLVTKGGHIENLEGRTETWGVSPSVDMLPFGVTIRATVPQRSEIPEGLTNHPVHLLPST